MGAGGLFCEVSCQCVDPWMFLVGCCLLGVLVELVVGGTQGLQETSLGMRGLVGLGWHAPYRTLFG